MAHYISRVATRRWPLHYKSIILRRRKGAFAKAADRLNQGFDFQRIRRGESVKSSFPALRTTRAFTSDIDRIT
jgi:hypothetical protein